MKRRTMSSHRLLIQPDQVYKDFQRIRGKPAKKYRGKKKGSRRSPPVQCWRGGISCIFVALIMHGAAIYITTYACTYERLSLPWGPREWWTDVLLRIRTWRLFVYDDGRRRTSPETGATKFCHSSCSFDLNLLVSRNTVQKTKTKQKKKHHETKRRKIRVSAPLLPSQQIVSKNEKPYTSNISVL